MRFPRATRRHVMAEALQLQRGSAASRNRHVQKSIEGYHELLPGQRCGFFRWVGPAVNAASGRLQPAAHDVFAPELAGDTMPLKPGGIDHHPFGEVVLDPV